MAAYFRMLCWEKPLGFGQLPLLLPNPPISSLVMKLLFQYPVVGFGRNLLANAEQRVFRVSQISMCL